MFSKLVLMAVFVLSSLGIDAAKSLSLEEKAVINGLAYRLSCYVPILPDTESISVGLTIPLGMHIMVPTHSLGVSPGVKDFKGIQNFYAGNFGAGDDTPLVNKKSDGPPAPAGLIFECNVDVSLLTPLITTALPSVSEDLPWIYGPGEKIALEIVNLSGKAIDISMAMTLIVLEGVQS